LVVFVYYFFFFFQAEDGIRDFHVTGVQTCALPISLQSVFSNEKEMLALLYIIKAYQEINGSFTVCYVIKDSNYTSKDHCPRWYSCYLYELICSSVINKYLN